MAAMVVNFRRSAICYDISERNLAQHRSHTVPSVERNSHVLLRGTDIWRTTSALNLDDHRKRSQCSHSRAEDKTRRTLLYAAAYSLRAGIVSTFDLDRTFTSEKHIGWTL